MPTYEFRCPDGTIIERFFKISEAPETIPVPGGEGVATRIISGGAGLLFKGSGFYITDYGHDGKKDQREAAGKAHKAESASGTESGSAGSNASSNTTSNTGSSTSPAPSSAPAASASGSGTE